MQNVIYYYSIWQPAFDIFSRENIVTQWVNEEPSIEDFKERTDKYKDKGGSLVIIDDFG